MKEKKDNKNKSTTNDNSKLNNNLEKQEDKKDKETEIGEEQLETIGKEISHNKKNSKTSAKKEFKYKKILKSILIAILYIIYFDLILFGKDKIPTIEFIRDIKVFIIMDLISSIVLLEIGLKKDSTSFFMYGIEMSFLGGFTLLILNWFGKQDQNINLWISIIVGIVVVYYIIKSIVIVRKKQEENSD